MLVVAGVSVVKHVLTSIVSYPTGDTKEGLSLLPLLLILIFLSELKSAFHLSIQVLCLSEVSNLTVHEPY